MTQDPARRDELVMTLVEAALRIPDADRESWVRGHCPEQADLRDEVLQRIHWELEMGGFLDQPALRPQERNPFEPDSLLGDRYRIVRKIDEGGMSVVYQARDETMGTDVALKIPHAAHRDRLRNEARLAIRVTHQNVCRVHPVQTAITPDGEIRFLTMEYLPGETLQQRIRFKGPLPIDDLGQLALQLCDGLAEAHKQGIVHGDLKGSNVILREGPGAIRPVITDFGLARLPGHDGVACLDSFRGTPDFLAPELWQGEAFSAASDIYALGVLLYEAATGTRPFSNDPSRRNAVAFVPPGRLRRDLPYRWARAIAACLNVDPARRPADAGAVRRSFLPFVTPARLASVLAVVAILFVCGNAVYMHYAPVPPTPMRIAILPPDADTGSLAWGGGALRQLSLRLSEYRGPSGPVVIIPPLDASAHSTIEEDFKKTGATHLLKARFRRAGAALRVDLSIRDAATGHTLQPFSGTYTEASIGILPQALVAAVSSALQLNGKQGPARISASAWADYLRGEGEMQKPQPDPDAAIASFQSSTRLDPESSLPWSGMTLALVFKYSLRSEPAFLELARNSLKEAISRDPDNIEAHLAAGLVDLESGLPERAAAEYLRILQLEPGNVDALRKLAGAYSDMELPDQAVQTWKQAIAQLPGYYRNYLDLGQFYYYRGKYPEAVENFLRVTSIAPDVAMGHHDLGAVYNDLGRYVEAEQSFRRALQLRVHSDTLIGLGAVLDYQKRPQDSIPFYLQARAVGPVTYLLLADLADAYRRAGRTAEARPTYQEALALADAALLERPRDGYVRAFVAYLCARLGENARAIRELSQALRFNPDQSKVKRLAIRTFGALHQRAEAQAILAAEPSLREEMSRQPDLSEFSPD